MIFQAQFDLDNLPDLKQMLDDNCQRFEGPLSDIAPSNRKGGLESQNPKNPSQKSTKSGKRREQNFVVRDMITCLALCHNVTPTYPDVNNPSIRDFQASSPDEVALVKFADSLGMQLLERDQQKIVILNTAGVQEEYQVLANFPFSSDTKRMGIVLRHNNSGKLVFYLKGSDTIMQSRIRPNQRAIIQEACENLAMEGLRTLVISQKLLEEDFFEAWLRKYNDAKADLNNREQSIAKCIADLELDMELLGVTGVEVREDLIQKRDLMQNSRELSVQRFSNMISPKINMTFNKDPLSAKNQSKQYKNKKYENPKIHELIQIIQT